MNVSDCVSDEMMQTFSIKSLDVGEKMIISFIMLFFDVLKFKLNSTNFNFLCNSASFNERQLKKCLSSLKRKKILKPINKSRLFFRLDLSNVR